MNDVIDLRTRLIYASLRDEDLVRQLEKARSEGASRASSGAALRSRRAPGHPGSTRPWLATVAPDEADDLMDADVTSSGAEAFVVDVRSTEAPSVTIDVRAPAAPRVVRRTSEWSADDPSYYLG